MIQLTEISVSAQNITVNVVSIVYEVRMHRILILDDDAEFAQSLKQRVQDFDPYERTEVDLATNSGQAFAAVERASQSGKTYTILLINQNLGPHKDGIEVMKELLAIDPEADAIIFTGFENSDDGIRAYEAGAKRYLSKASEPRELVFVLNDLVQLRRIRQRHQFKVAKEIAETVGTGLNLEKTMEAVLQKLSEVFKETSLCILLYDSKAHALKFAPATLKFYKIRNHQVKKTNFFPLDKGSIACRVARTALIKRTSIYENIANVIEDPDYIALNPMIRSEFCISLLNSKGNLLGVLVLEREPLNGFSNDDIELAQTVAQHLSIAIERAQISEELEYKSTIAAQTSWAAEIAHEINNEVYKIQTAAYLIKKKVEKESYVYKNVESIEESVANLVNIGQFRDQAPTIFEIDEDIRSYVIYLSEKRGVSPILKLNAPKTQIHVNKIGFHYVFKQLIDNAARVMKTQEERQICIMTRVIAHGKVEILFEDFGKGIDDNIRLSLFQRPITSKKSGGYGLLFTRQIIEGMNGEITLQPYRRGHGAKFSIKIPYVVV